MTHSVTFNSKTIESYGLILESVELGSPVPQTSMVKIPGRNGVLDYSEAIAGYVTYESRPMKFSLVRGGNLAQIDETKEAFLRDIHGQLVDIDLEWQGGYYHGRANVTVKDYSPNFLRLEVNVTADPYRLAETVSVVSLAAGSNTVTIAGALPVVPEIITTEQTIITFGTSSFTVTAGTHKIPGIVLMPGNNTITVTKAAQLSFTEGYL